MPEFNRIISLVPSLTELLIDLGLKNELIGRTRFCIHPEQHINDIEIVGGTKNPQLDKIIELKPDLIIANKEENQKNDIEILEKYSEVRVTEIDTIQDALIEINILGDKLGVKNKAHSLIQTITSYLDNKPDVTPLSVAYLIWKDPWMTVGKDTYIHDVLQEFNLVNVFGDRLRYPKISFQKLASKNPDLILLSSEPYPFKEKHLAEMQERFPVSKIQLVNGEWFSWYGSRMIKAFEWLNSWRSSL